MKIILVLVCLSFGIGWVQGQGRASGRYPHELSGFKLWSKYGLTGLDPGVSGQQEIDEVLGAVMGKCGPAWHGSVGACRLDENWDIGYTQIDRDPGTLSSVIFYPRRRIPFSRVRFPRAFERGGMMIVHSIDAEEFIQYSDKYGLKYVVVDEPGDPKYKKGDLFYVEYALTPAQDRKLRSEK